MRGAFLRLAVILLAVMIALLGFAYGQTYLEYQMKLEQVVKFHDLLEEDFAKVDQGTINLVRYVEKYASREKQFRSQATILIRQWRHSRNFTLRLEYYQKLHNLLGQFMLVLTKNDESITDDELQYVIKSLNESMRRITDNLLDYQVAAQAYSNLLQTPAMIFLVAPFVHPAPAPSVTPSQLFASQDQSARTMTTPKTATKAQSKTTTSPKTTTPVGKSIYEKGWE